MNKDNKKLPVLIWTLTGILLMGIFVAASTIISDSGITINGQSISTGGSNLNFIPGTNYKGISLGAGTIVNGQDGLRAYSFYSTAGLYPDFNISAYPSGNYYLAVLGSCKGTCYVQLVNSTGIVTQLNVITGVNVSTQIPLTNTETYSLKIYNTGTGGYTYAFNTYLVIE